ncbi:hypothetical protein RHMOL_Rhmol04G0157800 [Rhododendron molle]|uniref:Uncharacterized protein n=1 Tax=Rhododendron molle TaxID=49168 RepID=A0ACC0P0T2_RHOML|nr:hypothetical protein RHMOL_Rhmol04G0157800 [Rhododendron molle]
MSIEELLSIEPQELQFPCNFLPITSFLIFSFNLKYTTVFLIFSFYAFVAEKLQLTNKTSNYAAFKGYAREITTAEGGYGRELDEPLSSRKSVLTGL